MGQDVLAVDKDGELVNRWSSQIPHRAGRHDRRDGVGADQRLRFRYGLERSHRRQRRASVITAGNLLDAGISDIWAKSVSKEHARILQRIGARHITRGDRCRQTRRALGCPATI